MPIDVGTKGTQPAKKSAFVAPGKHAGMVAQGTLDTANRPVVKNNDGSISTVRSITVTDDRGRGIVIPTVVGGKVVSEKQAVAHYKKTGEHLGVFANEAEANRYARGLHEQQAKQYLEPPHPALQAAGFNGGIQEFNDRLAAVTAAHEETHGTRPTPGVAFDVARSSVQTQQIPGLFRSLPTMQRQASARAVAPEVPELTLTPRDFIKQMEGAAKLGVLNQFLDKHEDEVATLAKDKRWAPRVTRAIFDAQAEKNQAHADTMKAWDPGLAVKVVSNAGPQVAQSLVHAPGGFINATKAASLDTWDLAHGDVTPERTTAIVKAMAHQLGQDVRHPITNSGFLFLDVLGFGSAGAGTAARLAAGGRALSREGVAAAGKAVATKPRGGTFEIGPEGATEHALLSDNPLVAAAQKVRLQKKQKALDLTRVEGERAPAGLLSILQPESAKAFLDEHFSFANKVGREADARRRTEHIVNMTIARELDHVAGGSIVQSRALSRMPAPVRKGLTRGEQKAIQTVSFGVTPAEQITFHQRMIATGVGDPRAHKRQIADLKLAEKILSNPSPRGRFKKALELTQQVAAEMERKKVEDLGLSPLTARERVSKPRERMDNPVDGERVYPATGPVEPFYTKLEPRGKQKRGPSAAQGFFPTKPGPFGVPLPRPLPELTHEFTGSSITAGNYRIDATGLTTEAYARTVRAATVLNEHSRLWKSATDTPKTEFDIPIRDSRTVPDKLREILGTMDEGTFTDKEAASLPADMRGLIEELYPPMERLQGKPIEGVKWVDGRMLGAANDIPSRPGALAKGAQLVNEPFRILTLFLRPAYILNALGNSAMLIFHQGFAAIPNMAWALNAEKHLGVDGYRTAQALMGQGRSKSYTTAITPKVSRALAEGWSAITDDRFRIAAIREEMKALGYKTDEQMQALLRTGGKDLVEIKRRANKAMVEFDNLTPFEKNVMRHVIFVYPWVSRSVVWSLRSVMEHPLKTDFLAQLGREEIDSDPIFRNVPEWFKRVGYFPIGWTDDGQPKIVNPTSINSFSTLGDLSAILGAGLGGTKYAAFSDLLGPAAQLAEHAVTGKDDYGNAYPDKQWLRAAEDVLLGIPQISAYQRAHKDNPAAKTADPTRRDSFLSAFNSNLKRTSLSPGWLEGYGSLLAGGLSPRTADPDALEARFWKDATPEERHGHELKLLGEALKVQAGLLKEKLPDRVKQAVTVGSDVDFVYKQFNRDNGRQPTSKERAELLIKHLDEKGLMPDGAAKEALAKLKPMVAESDVKQLRNKVFNDFGGGDALKQWDADVRLVASFKKDVFKQKTAALYKDGLVSSPVPSADQEALYEYGRKYLKFTREAVGIKDAIKAGTATTADLRAFQDANDKSVNGLPSFTRTAWSYLPKEEQAKAVRSAAVTSWKTLTAFEKELLGRPSDAKVTAGWAKLKEVVDSQREALARTGEPFPAGYERILAKYVEKNFDAPGLVKDFDFSKKPLVDRLRTLKPIEDSPHRQDWQQVRQMWKDYVSSTLQPWIDEDPAFAREVKSYGRDVLSRLL